MASRRILVVGGNGFIGSAVCKAALGKGFEVTSISSSGRPYTTPKGHSPAWTSQVDWQRGDALQPDTYSHLLPKMYGVVHTIGTLFEGGKYKEALRKGDMFGTLSSFLGFQSRNPLDAEAKSGSYQVMNRDTALRVCEAFTSSKHESSSGVTTAVSRPFVYVSAEDILRPVVPAGYIESKRDAEVKIETIVENKKDFRPVFIRPGLVYHAHLRPMLSPAAVLLDISAGIHAKIPRGVPTPSDASLIFTRTTISIINIIRPAWVYQKRTCMMMTYLLPPLPTPLSKLSPSWAAVPRPHALKFPALFQALVQTEAMGW
jgi:nucleoside-diphosphate-sugar epimerase